MDTCKKSETKNRDEKTKQKNHKNKQRNQNSPDGAPPQIFHSVQCAGIYQSTSMDIVALNTN